MSRAAALLCLLSALFASTQARADLAAIRADALPQDAAILTAFDDARQLEPYSRAYTRTWAYPVPREDALSRLGRDLGFLKIALQEHPHNTELLLLTGLVAHYAFNLDLAGSYDAAMQSLDGAQKQAPADVRAAWFRASLLCQTSHPRAGADQFLAIEASRSWDRLPPAFWDDYMECATITDMAAHVLRAADHLEKLHARNSEMRDLLTEAALQRLDAFNPARTYKPKEVWQARDEAGSIQFTSTTCGLRFRTPAAWKLNDLSVEDGSCEAYFSTGPYPGTKHQRHPSIVLLARPPQGDETLEDLAKRYTARGTFHPFTPSSCPAERCIAMRGVQPGMYREDGDGHPTVIVFERDQPDFPGLLFESPWESSPSGPGEGEQNTPPERIKARIPGKLYYVVVLDAAASVDEPARNDLDSFLKSLVVE